MRGPFRSRRPRTRALLVALAVTSGGLLATTWPAPGSAATSRYYRFSSVSCVDANDCFVVGAMGKYRDGSSSTLIARWNGGRWALIASPNRTGFGRNALSGISCTAPDFCMAIGTSAKTSDSNAFQPLVERWDGTTWKIVPTVAALQKVSCTSKKLCMATTGATLQRWDGVKWAAIAAPRVDAGQRYGGIACVDASRCVAVGSYDTGEYQSRIIAALWNGRHWSQAPVSPSDVGESAGLYDAACSTRTACMAVGTGTNGLYSNGPFGQRWNGHAWSTSTPSAPSSIVSQLNGVACPSPAKCFAAGDDHSGPGPAGYPHPFVDQWNGAKWSVAAAPKTYGGLSDVDCASTTSCLAVGSSRADPNLDFTNTLALRWNGKAWTRVPIPNPA